MSSHHWFLLWPTRSPCKENHSMEPIVECYGVRLFIHRTHSLYYCCSAEVALSSKPNNVINTIVYLGKIPDSSIHESSITKAPIRIQHNLLSVLGDEDQDDNINPSTVYVEPISVLDVIAETIPKTSTDINMIKQFAKQPSYVFLACS